MPYICSHQIVERILKIIRRNNVHDCNNKTEHTINRDIEYNKEKYNQSIKERVTKLINENEKYFVYEVMRTTVDTIIHDNYHRGI